MWVYIIISISLETCDKQWWTLINCNNVWNSIGNCHSLFRTRKRNTKLLYGSKHGCSTVSAWSITGPQVKKGSSPASRECRAPKVALKQLVFGKDLLKLPPAITICCAGQRSPHCLVNQHSRRSIRIIRNSLDKGNEMSNPWLILHPYLDGTWIFGSCVETNYSPFSWVTMQYANYFMDNYICTYTFIDTYSIYICIVFKNTDY